MTSLSASTHPGVAHFLAHLVDRIKETRLSDEDRRLVRQHLLDAIASAFIGCRKTSFQDLAALCPETEEGSGWPGSGGKRVCPLDGAMLWSFAINGSVYEDGSREGACHPAAVVVPTVLAFTKGRAWEEIDRAIAAGYEVMVRMARSGNPQFTRRGFHPTAIVAPFGAAAAVSSLLGYNVSKTKNALSLAAMGGAGLMASFRSDETQPLQVACSVRNGILAAGMAERGHSGYPLMIEEGFFAAHLADSLAIPVEQPLQYEYAFRGSYLKPYPGCRHVHPSIDALGEILNRQKVAASQIEKIRVRTYQVAVDTEIHELRTRGDAYFNIPYALAARILLGKTDWEAFDEKYFISENLIELMKKVQVLVDPEMERHYPHRRGSLVEIRMIDGSVLTGKVDHALGEPEHPLPPSVTREKFRKAAGDFLTEKAIDRVETLLGVTDLTETPEQLLELLNQNKGRLRGTEK